MSTAINLVDYPSPHDSDGNLLTSLGTKISGEDTANDRLMVYELWDYGEDNLSESGIVKAAPGVLGVAQVITADAGETVTFYDNAAAGSGVVLGILPLDTVGTQITFARPAAAGIYATFSAAGGVAAVGIL